MEQTSRLGLPLLAPGQAQKEWFHNEALTLADMALFPAVEEPPSPSPPAAPAIGSCYLVGAGATGDWTEREGALACMTDGGWRYAPPVEGAQIFDKSSGQLLVRNGGAWEAGIVRAQEVRVDGQAVVGQRQPAIADPAGGSNVDAECRAATGQILTALRNHGLIG